MSKKTADERLWESMSPLHDQERQMCHVLVKIKNAMPERSIVVAQLCKNRCDTHPKEI